MTLAQKTKKGFTYADYLTWPDDERWELIDGEAYNMTPAHSFKHQKIIFPTMQPMYGSTNKAFTCQSYATKRKMVLR